MGFLLIFLLATFVDHGSFADHGYISEAWPAAYGIVQVLPLMALEITGFSQLRLMRKAATRRRAGLRPRRLFDFISPAMLGLAIALVLGALAFDYYANDYQFQWDQALVFTAGNLFMAAVGLWAVYGRKLDPHQSSGDRERQLGATLHSLVYASLVLSAFILARGLDDLLDLDYLDATVMSLYFQVIVAAAVGTLLRRVKLEDIDFEVYRNEAAAG